MVVSSISDMEGGKRMLRSGIREEMRFEINQFRTWMDENLAQADRKFLEDNIDSDENLLYACYMITKQSEEGSEDKLHSIVRDLGERSGLLWLIVGEMRSGKTSLLHILGESVKKLSGKDVWWYGPPARVPDYIDGHTMDMSRIPVNSIVLVDEATVQFFSRTNSQTSDDFIRRLPIISHSGRNVIFCTQSSSINDLNIVRLSKAILYKTRTVLQAETERGEIRHSLSSQLDIFMPKDPSQVLYVDNSQILQFDYPLPEWWSDDYSRPYAPFRTKAESYRFLLEMFRDGIEDERILEFLGIREKYMKRDELDRLIMIARHYGVDEILNQDNDTLTFFLEQGFDDTPVEEQAQGEYKQLTGDFELPAMAAEEDRRKRENDIKYAKFSQVNVNPMFIDHCRFRFSNHGNVIISVVGRPAEKTGSGKSYSSMSLGRFFCSELGTKFSPSSIHFDINKIMEAMRRKGKKTTLVMDEQIPEFGAGSGTMQMQMTRAEETMRKRQINFIYNSPTPHTHSHDFVLQTYGIDRKQGIARLLVYVEYPGVPYGYITLRKPPLKLSAKYEKKKDTFLDRVTARKTGLQQMKEESMKKLLDDPVYSALNTKSQRITYIKKRYHTIQSVAEEINDLVTIKEKEEEFADHLPPSKPSSD